MATIEKKEKSIVRSFGVSEVWKVENYKKLGKFNNNANVTGFEKGRCKGNTK